MPESASELEKAERELIPVTVWAEIDGRLEREPGLTPHGLRHTNATLRIVGGQPPQDVSRQLGHTNPAFTFATYVHAGDADPKEARRVKALFFGEDVKVPEAQAVTA